VLTTILHVVVFTEQNDSEPLCGTHPEPIDQRMLARLPSAAKAPVGKTVGASDG
jgi:hypothetical protein